MKIQTYSNQNPIQSHFWPIAFFLTLSRNTTELVKNRLEEQASSQGRAKPMLIEFGIQPKQESCGLQSWWWWKLWQMLFVSCILMCPLFPRPPCLLSVVYGGAIVMLGGKIGVQVPLMNHLEINCREHSHIKNQPQQQRCQERSNDSTTSERQQLKPNINLSFTTLP